MELAEEDGWVGLLGGVLCQNLRFWVELGFYQTLFSVSWDHNTLTGLSDRVDRSTCEKLMAWFALS